MKRIAIGAVLAALAAAAVGNWERGGRADEQSAGMRRVVETVGPLDSREFRGYRILANFQCLVYERGRNDFALEVCVDADGRVVEAIDRRDGTPEVWSLRDDPTRSDVRVDRTLVDELLDRATT
ncbi:MAG TPA: hypothetical protein VE444_08475 [Gaiellaceae bacterium]|nr:hypothetical protein [Gaiellaceae bacterium]